MFSLPQIQVSLALPYSFPPSLLPSLITFSMYISFTPSNFAKNSILLFKSYRYLLSFFQIQDHNIYLFPPSFSSPTFVVFFYHFHLFKVFHLIPHHPFVFFNFSLMYNFSSLLTSCSILLNLYFSLQLLHSLFSSFKLLLYKYFTIIQHQSPPPTLPISQIGS